MLFKALTKAFRIVMGGIGKIIPSIPYFKFIKETRDTQTPATFLVWVCQKIIGINRHVYWPVHPTSKVTGYKNIYCGIETSPGLMPGCYIQGIGKVYIGDYTQIGPSVGIISANHSLYDNREHLASEVRIGKYCWIGMGAIILPGVILGDYTIVAAGSVVSKSYPEGYCVVGGVPAKVIKNIDPEKCVFHKSAHEYNGYIRSEKFEQFRTYHLYVNRYEEIMARDDKAKVEIL